MFIQLSCNEYFGMDGYTYDYHGQSVGEEYITINTPIQPIIPTDPDRSEQAEEEKKELSSPITCIFFSEVPRFQHI
jgi:hypothetical protein